LDAAYMYVIPSGWWYLQNWTTKHVIGVVQVEKFIGKT